MCFKKTTHISEYSQIVIGLIFHDSLHKIARTLMECVQLKTEIL